jgi:hypothetical protein
MQHLQYEPELAPGVGRASVSSVGSQVKRATPSRFWLRARPWVLQAVGALPIVLLLLLFNVTGLRGVDYGYHWDEAGWHTGPARTMIQTGVLLPKSYIYPSLDKWLVILPAVPAAIRSVLEVGLKTLPIQTAMLAVMDAPDYLLRVRAVFIVVSSLAILWVYGAAIAVGHRRWQALVAAACLALSWEYAYHSRWAVTDCILTQFSALTLYMLALYQRRGSRHWLYAAAVAAGLGTGTKYTGVFLLFPVLYAGALTLPLRAFWAQLRRAVEVCAIAFGTYLLTTPATVLDPFLFINETHYISTYYMHDHGGFTAFSAWHHGWIVFEYFALAYFSPSHWLAALEFVFCIAGVVLWLKKRLRFGLVVAGFPLVFLLFFCLRYRVVMVRNYLFLVPFMALFLARAVSDFMRWLPRRPLQYAFAAGLISVLLVQAFWLVEAGESIRHFDPALYTKQALDYVRDHADTRFRVSKQVRALARRSDVDMPPNVVSGSEGSQVVFFGKAEGPADPYKWATNDPFLTKAVFGPREVNFNYYSSWFGNDHVVIMDMKRAKDTGVQPAQ